jgi:hypothetical protein
MVFDSSRCNLQRMHAEREIRDVHIREAQEFDLKPSNFSTR